MYAAAQSFAKCLLLEKYYFKQNAAIFDSNLCRCNTPLGVGPLEGEGNVMVVLSYLMGGND